MKTTKDINRTLWEYGPCPLCGNTDVGFTLYRFGPSSKRSFSIPRGSDPETIEVRKCPCCGLFYLYPRLMEKFLQSVYASKDYFMKDVGPGYEDYAIQEISLRLTFQRFLIALRWQGLVRGAMADIGCGFGYLLDEAKPFFSLRMGTDMCDDVASMASRRCDNVECGGPEALILKGLRFDLVTSIGVLEHIYDPVAFLESCKELTREGGAVVIVTPDINGFWRRFMGKRWPSFKLPEHIAFYDKKTLRILASKAGMELVRVFPYHQVFPVGLILGKLGFTLAGKTGWTRLSVLLPRVMMAAVFRKGIEGLRD